MVTSMNQLMMNLIKLQKGERVLPNKMKQLRLDNEFDSVRKSGRNKQGQWNRNS